jgi:ethanolamine utilization microcompartment shell protein EutL
MTSTVARLREAVRESGTPLASSLGDEPPEGEADAAERALLAAAGPRVAAHRGDVEIAVAAVDEGYRLHYASSRALRIEDPDLALLAGDRMYALGLARLAAIGDLTAIAELADVIALGAQAHAGGDADLADAAWQAGVAAIAHGPSPETDAAKALARTGDRSAAGALRDAAKALIDTTAT